METVLFFPLPMYSHFRSICLIFLSFYLLHIYCSWPSICHVNPCVCACAHAYVCFASTCVLNGGLFSSTYTAIHTVWWPHQQPIVLSVAAGRLQPMGEARRWCVSRRDAAPWKLQRVPQLPLVAPHAFVYPCLHEWVHFSAWENVYCLVVLFCFLLLCQLKVLFLLFCFLSDNNKRKVWLICS